MKSSGSPCFLIFPGVEVRLRADENIQQHICKVSAKGSHRREPIYRKAITGSKRYILILLTACNGFPSGEARKWRRQGSHADRREACLPYGTQREGGMKSGCNVCRSRAEEHVTDQPRKWRLHISPGGARGPGDLCLAPTVAERRRGGGARTVCQLAYFASLHTVARGQEWYTTRTEEYGFFY